MQSSPEDFQKRFDSLPEHTRTFLRKRREEIYKEAQKGDGQLPARDGMRLSTKLDLFVIMCALALLALALYTEYGINLLDIGGKYVISLLDPGTPPARSS